MPTNALPIRMRRVIVSIAAALVLLTVATPHAGAKTPDGMTPAEETVCSGLEGAAFGLCNAYCEAQDCDVHPRPSCDQLRENFLKHTGSAIFPCDAVAACGNGTLDPGEDCDPPGSACADGRICDDDCLCPAAFCGDGIVDADEECDPPGSMCADGGPCTDTCVCEPPPPPSICCQCGNPDLGFSCVDTTVACPAGCQPVPDASCVGALCAPNP